MSSTTKKRGALIFLHGLGDGPHGWKALQRQLPALRPRLAQLEYIFPAAPVIPISINGGSRMPGWFDLYDWPISVGAQDDRDGKQAAVQQIEAIIDQLEKDGMDRSKIIVGGFSQGGAIAMLTAYHNALSSHSDRPALGGVVALSGWLTMTDTLVVSETAKQIPCWWGHGTYDDKVLFKHQAFGARKLNDMGVNIVITEQYEMGHESDREEKIALAEFLDRTLFGEDDEKKPEPQTEL
jgi:lysophospholipase-2